MQIIKMLVLLGFLIFIHEGGHCLTAKFFKIKVNKFAIGFGPTIFSLKRNDTLYEIKTIPLGGFVSLEGEEELSNKEGSFSNARDYQKIAILSAGAMVNIIFGIITLIIIMSTKYSIENNQNIFNSIGYGINFIGELFNEMFISFKGIFSGSTGIDDFSGPVGISSIVAKTTGIFEFVYILSVISISLGITNLLPIIPLDGGKIFIIILEKIRGKSFNEKTQAKIQSIGLSVLLLFSVLVMINDFKKM